MTYREKVETILTNNTMSPDGARCVASLIASIDALNRIMKDEGQNNDVKQAILQHMCDFAYLFLESEWWQKNRGLLMPVYLTALNSFIDAGKYVDKINDPICAGQVITCRSLVYELGVVGLLADRGAVVMRERGSAIRDELIRLE